MYKYFEKYSQTYKTTIYYCQIDGWNYCCVEYKNKNWVGSFYDFIEIDWKTWENNKELPNELEALPQDAMHKMIDFIYS